MESSALVRRVTFGLVVFVLVGLGAYLIGPVAHGSGRPGGQATPRPTPSSTPAPTPAARPTPTGAPDIYQWLPFTPAGLTAAASVARQFGAAYGTYSYTQSAASYAAALQPLASAQLVGQIKAAYATPGVATARSRARQVSVGTAVIESIRAFGVTSLTFVVQITEQLTSTTGHSDLVTLYAITLTGSGSAWQVSDIELAAAGNQ